MRKFRILYIGIFLHFRIILKMGEFINADPQSHNYQNFWFLLCCCWWAKWATEFNFTTCKSAV